MKKDMKSMGDIFTPDEIQKAMKSLAFDDEQITNVINRLRQ